MAKAGAYVPAAKLSELAAGQFKPVELDGKRLLICRTDDGVYAIDDTCTHDDGPLADGWLEGREIECPRHGARFDVTTGKVICLPAAVPINSYRVRIEADAILVNVHEVVPKP
jgi:3-phenylpropionate/trans-cinnamate dioxygenase ferredoxin subunit